MKNDTKPEAGSQSGQHILITHMPSGALVADSESVPVHLLIEPYTFAWVALHLAEGAVAYVGGQILKSALGGADPTADIVRRAVEELKVYLDGKFDELIIRLAKRDIETGYQLLLDSDSSGNPKTKDAMLREVNSMSLNAISALMGVEEKSLGPLTHAISLRLTALVAFQRAGDHSLAASGIKRLVSDGNSPVALVRRWIHQIDSRHTGLIANVGRVATGVSRKASRSVKSGRDVPAQYFYEFFENNSRVYKAGFESERKAEEEGMAEQAAYVRSYTSRREAMRKAICYPMESVVKCWFAAEEEILRRAGAIGTSG